MLKNVPSLVRVFSQFHVTILLSFNNFGEQIKFKDLALNLSQLCNYPLNFQVQSHTHNKYQISSSLNTKSYFAREHKSKETDTQPVKQRQGRKTLDKTSSC